MDRIIPSRLGGILPRAPWPSSTNISLSEDLQEADRRVEQIKHAIHLLKKRLADSLQGQGVDDHSLDKRQKKLPHCILGNAMKEGVSAIHEDSVLKKIMQDSGEMEIKMGQNHLQYEVNIERDILSKINKLLDNDIPAVSKQRSLLTKLINEMYKIQSRLDSAQRQNTASAGQNSQRKVEAIQAELEDCGMKVDQAKDALGAEIFSLVSRESEIAQLVVDMIEMQQNYHRQQLEMLDATKPELIAILENNTHKPIFGCLLEEHLRVSSRSIAFPIELCVCALMQIGMEEEGLFRVAGGAARVRKLRTAFDAGYATVDMILNMCDPHVVASTLKLYLRELPTPLLTLDLYDEWKQAVSMADENERKQKLSEVISRLPKPYHTNLSYLIHFLARLASFSEINKMTPQNVAIVIAPTLIWSKITENCIGDVIGMNMSEANKHSLIIDQLVSNAGEFFPEEVEFYQTYSQTEFRSSSSMETHSTAPPSRQQSETQQTEHENKQASRNNQLYMNSPKPVHKNKKPPAPKPPQHPPPGGTEPRTPHISGGRPPPSPTVPPVPMNTRPPPPPQPLYLPDAHQQEKPSLPDRPVLLPRKVSDTEGVEPVGFEHLQTSDCDEHVDETDHPVAPIRTVPGRTVERQLGFVVDEPKKPVPAERKVASFVENTEKPEVPTHKPSLPVKRFSSNLDTERTKPVIPERPSLKSKNSKSEESLDKRNSLLIEVNKSEPAYVETTHVYSVDKHQPAIVSVAGNEGLEDSSSHAFKSGQVKPDVPEKPGKSTFPLHQESGEMFRERSATLPREKPRSENGTGYRTQVHVNGPGNQVFPQRPPRPSHPPPKPRTGESTQL